MKDHLLIILIALLTIQVSNAQILYIPGGINGVGTSTSVNIGIGTNLPTKLLDVNGDVRIGNLSSRNYLKITSQEWPEIRFETTLSNEKMRIGIAHSDNSGYPVQEGDLYFYTQDVNSMPFILRKSGNVLLNVSLGNVGIGTTSPQNKLDVNGTIRAKEVKVTLEGWSDFVFKPSYKLKPLSEVEQYINKNGHLPEVPSETEVKQNGVNVGDMQAKLLQKVEELTLYVIEQEKKMNAQSLIIEEQNKVIQQLKVQINKK
ncbi:MAG: hypothetical protein Q8928_10270 [Bacteroidota bacterium]|nr:hypothetical protein [Bacteroidota bacterium]